MPDTDIDIVTEPSSGSYGVRTGLQTGVSISGFIGLCKAFGWWDPTADQVLYASPFLAAAGTILWRLVENRLGKGLLRQV